MFKCVYTHTCIHYVTNKVLSRIRSIMPMTPGCGVGRSPLATWRLSEPWLLGFLYCSGRQDSINLCLSLAVLKLLSHYNEKKWNETWPRKNPWFWQHSKTCSEGLAFEGQHNPSEKVLIHSCWKVFHGYMIQVPWGLSGTWSREWSNLNRSPHENWAQHKVLQVR